MSMDPQDFINRSRLSNCCGAPIMLGDMCSDCHEHCEADQETDEPMTTPTPPSASDSTTPEAPAEGPTPLSVYAFTALEWTGEIPGMARQVGNARVVRLNVAERELTACQKERDEARMICQRAAVRDGNWLDEWGSCRVCGGEIPHGHTENCDLFKREKRERGLEAELTALRQVCAEAVSPQDYAALEAQLVEANRIIADLRSFKADASKDEDKATVILHLRSQLATVARERDAQIAFTNDIATHCEDIEKQLIALRENAEIGWQNIQKERESKSCMLSDLQRKLTEARQECERLTQSEKAAHEIKSAEKLILLAEIEAHAALQADHAALREVAEKTRDLPAYDTGLLGGHADCSVEWWHDYIRAELERAHVHYLETIEALLTPARKEEGRT